MRNVIVVDGEMVSALDEVGKVPGAMALNGDAFSNRSSVFQQFI